MSQVILGYRMKLAYKGAGAGEMAQWITALVAFTEDPGSVFSTNIVAHNYL